MENNTGINATEQSTSDPYYLIIADIFGDSDALQRFAKDLGKPFKVISPYTKPLHFNDEAAAYEHFMQQVGLQQYAQKIELQLEKLTSPVIILAFSVGASAIWLLSDKLEEKIQGNIAQVNCFYSAQIRHSLTLEPILPMRLIFPAEETHFDINCVMQQLKSKSNVELIITPWLHGFMNHLSINFSDKGYQFYLRQLKDEQIGLS